MLEPRVLMSHPFKLSTMREPEAQERLFGWLEAIRTHGPAAQLGPLSFGVSAGFPTRAEGWHGEEAWGRWSAGIEASLSFWAPSGRPPNGVRVRLQAPLSPVHGPLTGALRLNEGAGQELQVAWGEPSIFDVLLPGEDMLPGQMNTITVRSDRLIRPCDLNAASGDQRPLGFGVFEVELL